MSNSIIHHIPEPIDSFREMVRLVRPGGLLFVRDLMRPPDLPTLQQLVETYAGDANPHQKKMFGESLHAALTLDEVREMVRACGLRDEIAAPSSDRHWTIAWRR
jgi:SAM-dependent methyltransferase